MVALRSDSLERIVPDELDESEAIGLDALRLHLERYEFAARFVRAGRVLDIACGVGYGTRLPYGPPSLRSPRELSLRGSCLSASLSS